MQNDEERIARIRLARTSGIGPLTYSRFLDTYGSGLTSIEAFPERVKTSGRGDVKLYARDAVLREIERTERLGARILLSCDEDYPKLLAQLSPPPPVISVWGDIGVLTKPCIAMVGSRNASAAAVKIAHTMAHDLSEAGYTIVSGMARGVDTAAHKGSVQHGTVAVIAGGVDNVYPAQNAGLRDEIIKTGLIVSESPFGHEPRSKDFPRRNRLITGLSLGVVVVEAAQRSGSLISARTAGEQGRDVMAVPGSPLDPRTKGSNGLIRTGAMLVETADDVLQIISPAQNIQGSLFEAEHESEPEDEIEITGADRDKILEALSPTAATIADISMTSGISVRACAILLVELELAGLATSLPGGLVRRAT